MRRMIQVGAGAFGATWSDKVRNSPDFELTALCEIESSARRRVAERAGLAAGYTFATLEDALAAGVEADCALIVVPPELHAPVALTAVQGGLHCLIEKPFTDTLDAARHVVSVAERVGRQVMVSQNYRFKSAPRTVRRLIREGTIGPLGEVHVKFKKRPTFTGFRTEMHEPLIVDMAVHHLDQVRGVLGVEPTSIRARSWNPAWSIFRGNSSALVEMQTADGAQIIYQGSWSAYGSHTSWDGAWDIQGERGAISWDFNRVEVHFASVLDMVFLDGAVEREDGRMEVRLDTVDYEERAGTLHEFALALDEGRPAETNGEDNLKSLALVLAAVASADQGGALIDDLESWSRRDRSYPDEEHRPMDGHLDPERTAQA